MPDARPVVTFDMDGVLCRPPLGINPGTGKGKRRHAPGRRNLLWLTERWRYKWGRTPMPGARDAFLEAATFADCHVVSARGEAARPTTEAWFRRHFGFVPPLHMRPHWCETSAQFKVRKLGELGAAAHVEDDPHTARWLAELLPLVVMVDWRRNRWLEAEGPLVRVDGLDEVPRVLRERFPGGCEAARRGV